MLDYTPFLHLQKPEATGWLDFRGDPSKANASTMKMLSEGLMKQSNAVSAGRHKCRLNTQSLF
jgi:hypothetical protein